MTLRDATLELNRFLNSYDFVAVIRILCWVLIFVIKLRFPLGLSIADLFRRVFFGFGNVVQYCNACETLKNNQRVNVPRVQVIIMYFWAREGIQNFRNIFRLNFRRDRRSSVDQAQTCHVYFPVGSQQLNT